MQLAFNITLSEDATFANFLPGDNAALINALQQASTAHGEPNLVCWGQRGTGVSHLLQATYHAAIQHGLAAMYLPIAEFNIFGPDVLKQLGQLDLVCLDDIQLVLGDPVWEEALFHQINRLKDSGKYLVIGSHQAPGDLLINLPDLASRLRMGGCFQIKELPDSDKIMLLQQAAKRRGFSLADDVAKYLINHFPRDMATQLAILQKLDLASLQQQHKVTVPFVKAVLH